VKQTIEKSISFAFVMTINTMMTRLSYLAISLLLASEAQAHSTVDLDGAINISPDSDIGRHLMQHARRLDQSYYEDVAVDSNFIASYAVKFQGCHHVQQWNPDASEDQDAVRIMTKRLVRFRLCPSDNCNSDNTAGCSSNYGDYVVDMNTFLSAYIENAQNLGYYRRLDEGEDAEDFDLMDYTECTEFEDGYYIGPYCASQGGAIMMGIFTDDTCTTFTSSDYYQYVNGVALPYSDRSMVSTSCMSCYGDSDYEQQYANGGNENYQANDLCSSIYTYAGKCETKMKIDYPNEGACTYIDGVKIIREDGIIRTSANRKSKVAAGFIGLLLTMAALLGGYIYYLRTKLTRSRVNLNAASEQIS
jgi:hypothetical protein